MIPALSRRAGFTILEMSLVLILIGLIVGGVVAGQEMVKSAKLRSQVSQLEQYGAAVNTFRTKYNAWPGDLGSAINFFPALTPAVCNGGTGQANGNDTIESSGTD